MRNSCLEWLGPLPEHWEVAATKRHYAIQLGKMLQTAPNKDDDIEVPYLKAKHVQWFDVQVSDSPKMWASPRELDQFGIALGDLLVCEGGEGGRCGIVKRQTESCIFQNALHRVRPRQESHNGFLLYVLRSVADRGWFDALNDKATIAHFTREKFGALRIPRPPYAEQAAIVRFLDHADRRIQRYIRAKQKLIALLQEHKQAVIHQAVTGQIDVRTGQPFPKYKSSGVECIGDIPKNWSVRPFKSLVKRIDQGISPQAERHLADGGAWGVLKAGCVNGGVFRQREHKRLPWGFEFDAALAVSPGDVLVARASGSPHFVGSTGRVPALQYKLILSDKTFRPVFSVDLDASFMVLAMNGSYFRGQVERAISGAEGLANNLPLSALRAFRLAIPSVDEQRMIVGYARTFSESLSKSIEQARRMISLLREYRSRLISDVVTGKFDVRGPKGTLQRWRSIGDPLHRNPGSCA